jgi:hypothetical protein
VKYEYGVVAIERGKTVSITRADNFERVSEEALLQTLSRLGQEGWLVSASMPESGQSFQAIANHKTPTLKRLSFFPERAFSFAGIATPGAERQQSPRCWN